MARVVVFGVTPTSQMYFEYLLHDAGHDVVAFTADARYIVDTHLFDRPVVPFESISTSFPPESHELAIPLGFSGVNDLRAAKFRAAKAMGYRCISYVSSRAMVWPNCEIGENTFISEGAVIKPFARLGNNVIVESGVVVGHHAVIHDHVFLGPGSSVLGQVTVGESAVIGANAVVRDGVHVGRRAIVGASALIARDVLDKGVFLAAAAEQAPADSDELGPVLLPSMVQRPAQ